jgi:hypothetical protein
MRRPLAVTLTLLAVALVSLPVAAHVNQVNADPQVSANGTVVVENAGAVVDGFVAVHATDDSGDPGAVLGYVAFERNDFRVGFTIEIDDRGWDTWGENRTVWVALHRNEGDSGFDPSEDPIQVSFGSRVAERLELGKADSETSVAAERLERQTTSTDSVTVDRVALPADGVLAIRTDTDDPELVGQRRLDAGVHHNVTIALADDLFTPDRRQVPLLATLYPEPDNGTLSTASTPLRVGNATIQTGFTVERTGPIAVANATNTTNATATTTPTPTVTDEPLVVTPSPTATATATPAPTQAATTTDATATTSTSGPGFGTVAVTLALLLVTLCAVGLDHRRP